MANTTYQGWTNYETWAVNLWLDNEEGVHDYWRERALECWEETAPTSFSTRDEMALQHLADFLKDYHVESRPELHGVFGDLLDAALTEVNWREIARSLIEEMDGA